MSFIRLLLLAALVPLIAAAGPNLNPTHGSAVYQSWSIFSPDITDPSDYADKVVVYFHGYRSAIPNGTYKRLRKRLKKTHTVIGVNYDYLDPAATLKNLEKFHETHLKGRSVTVVGTSLGGFWAEYFGTRIGAEKIVLLNPVSQPTVQLIKYAGTEHLNPRRKLTLSVSKDQIMSYAPLEKDGTSAPTRLLILAKDDDKLDYRIALKHYGEKAGTTVKLYDEGGHSINLKKHPAAKFIAAFVRGEGS